MTVRRTKTHWEWALLVGIGIMILINGGCSATTKVQDVHTTVREYMRAVGNGDVETAWQLLHPSVQKNINRSEFENKIIALRAQDKVLWQNWAREINANSVVHRLQRGPHTIRIIQHRNGDWRVGETGLDTTTQISPKLALSQFRQWVLARNYRGIYDMAPMMERQTLSPEIIEARLTESGVSEELVATLNNLIQSNNSREIDANRWIIEAGRHMAILVLENERWCIADIR